jgi:hypothetical protein
MKRLLEFAAIAFLTVVASAPVLAQSNPVVGTWKLNLEKSKFNPGFDAEWCRHHRHQAHGLQHV